MTDNHPITPPPELREQWLQSPHDALVQAARWGADQQLELDARWLDHNALNETHLKITPIGDVLKEAMRPKPQGLKKQALESVKRFETSGEFFSYQMRELEFIRKALEQLDD